MQSLIIFIVKGNVVVVVVVVAVPLNLELRWGRVSEVIGVWRCHITRHKKAWPDLRSVMFPVCHALE